MSEHLAWMRELVAGEHVIVRADQTCWFLLNGGTRACIKERGHDAGVHEGPSAKTCPDSDTHEPHPWTEKHQCEGAG